MRIIVRGLASGRDKELEIPQDDYGEILLFWLRKNGIPIASSCDGEGVCKKCGIQNGWLTCELTWESFFKLSQDKIIEVSYL